MRHINTRVLQACAASIMCIASGAWAADLPAEDARADPFEHVTPFLALDEVRVGVLAANLEKGTSEDANTLINAEFLFGRSNHVYADPIANFFLRPRPHIGVSISADEGGTNQVYAGVTWELKLTDRLFVETSFGGTLHDGPTDANDGDSYGCPLLFRESASIGVNITEHVRIMATVDHMSNAGLCDQNNGLTNAGVRLGYRW
jgi:lipid A 3-O-deacylase